MDDLSKALGDITTIRRQLAGSTEFRGYGPVTLTLTGLIAVGASVAQAVWVPSPNAHPWAYLAIWTATALLCAGLTLVGMVARTRRLHSGISNEMLRQAAEQFLPALLAGTLATGTLAAYALAQLWLLPALWQIVFSLGIFASCRFLPRPMLAAGSWYLVSGLLSLHFGDVRALSPWTMGLAFGAGQFLVAGILLFTAQEHAS